MIWLSRIMLLCLVLMIGLMPVSAQDDPACPGAPVPRLVVNERGRVLPGDSNNVRGQPTRGAELIGAIPGGAAFNVLEGPVCADGLNWWRVETDDITGWTVEGADGEYWIEPLTSVEETPVESASEWVNPYRNPEHPVANRLTVGATARVQSATDESLPLYAAPEDTTSAQELPVSTLVTLVEEGVNGWWRVESEAGSGWVREASLLPRSTYKLTPTLVPICPYTEDRVLFLTYDSALGSNLYTVGRDGTHLCNLSYGLQKDFEVYDWSPDGKWIAYSAVIEAGSQCAYGCDGELYVESVDGSVLRRLTFGQHAGHVKWSPDGEWLAVQVDGDEPNTRAIYLIRPDGSDERTLVTNKDGFALMDWSPDGKQLAVVENANLNADFYQFIRLIDVETGEAQIFYESRWRIESIDWSPDGGFIVVATYDPTARQLLLEIEVDTGESRELVDVETRGGVYSPDGSRVAFWRTDLGAPRWLEVVDRTTGEITRLVGLPGVNGRGISWTPEGDAVLVGSSGVMRVAAADGALRSLFVGSFGSNWYPPLAQPGG